MIKDNITNVKERKIPKRELLLLLFMSTIACLIFLHGLVRLNIITTVII